MAKILVVEDDPGTALIVQDTLEFEHYIVEVVADGLMAMEYLRSFSYDLIVLDFNLPGMTGAEICRTFRAEGGTSPVIMLTSRQELPDKATGFSSGVDDYLPKPFAPQELVWRIKSLLRRATGVLSERLKAGHIEMDLESKIVWKRGVEVHLSPIEFALLEFFLRHPGRVFGQEALLDSVWPSTSERTADTVRTCIRRLRVKIDVEGEPSLISNVHGAGYKLRPS